MIVVQVIDLLDADLRDGDVLDACGLVSAFHLGGDPLILGSCDFSWIESHQGSIAVGEEDVILAFPCVADHIERTIVRSEFGDGCAFDVAAVDELLGGKCDEGCARVGCQDVRHFGKVVGHQGADR